MALEKASQELILALAVVEILAWLFTIFMLPPKIKLLKSLLTSFYLVQEKTLADYGCKGNSVRKNFEGKAFRTPLITDLTKNNLFYNRAMVIYMPIYDANMNGLHC